MSEECPEAFVRVLRKAHKQHRCCECGGVIQRGERYTFMSGIWDGTPLTFKSCPECTQLGFEADLRCKTDPWDRRLIGGLLEFIEDDEDLVKKFNDNATRRKTPTASA